MLENQIPSTPVLIKDLGMGYANNNTKKRHFGLYMCSCGEEFKARVDCIKNEHTKSCGCYQKQKTRDIGTKHGLHNHRLYYTWSNMIKRTSNCKNANFKDYGGRGINVCERWLDIHNFIADMYQTFEEGLTLDRINNDGNYEPSNCRWATPSTQQRNSRVIRSTNTSGYKGVSFSKAYSNWVAQIHVNNKTQVLGRFKTALDAAIAYDTYVIENNLSHTINGVTK